MIRVHLKQKATADFEDAGFVTDKNVKDGETIKYMRTGELYIERTIESASGPAKALIAVFAQGEWVYVEFISDTGGRKRPN